MDGTTDAQSPVDPISRQIFERTYSHHKLQRTPTSPIHGDGGFENFTSPARFTTNASSSEYVDSTRANTIVSPKQGRDKKHRSSFLSRLIGNKKKDESPEREPTTDAVDDRQAGYEADVFSQPIGFVPRFPAPPRYIRVKAQNRTRRDFDRLFLAQILAERAPNKKKAEDIDNKIHPIDALPSSVSTTAAASPIDRAIWAAGFSRDGLHFAAGGQDKKLRVWRIISREDRNQDTSDADTGDDDDDDRKLNAPVFKKEIVREYNGHTSAILDLTWSKNNFLLSSSMDKTVRLYHLSRPECLCSFKHTDFVTSIAFHPRDDRFFLAGSLDSRVRLWSIPDKSVAYSAQVADMVTAVAFTPDGKTAIAGSLSGMCIIYDTDGLKAHSQIQVRSNRGKNAKGSRITGIETIAVPRLNGQPDVKILITSNDSRVRLYNLRDRSLEIKFRGNQNTQSQIKASFSDDGKFVICGSEDKKVYIWPTSAPEKTDLDKRPIEVFEAHNSTVTIAQFLPAQSRRLLALSGDPIYDICSPPPVQLISRQDSALSSQAPSQKNGTASEKEDLVGHVAEESAEVRARNSHYAGNIIVTADHSGEIKVFRQDCAFKRRRESAWDTASLRKALARSGSIVTKSSGASRRSTQIDGRSLADTSIINWRNSIASPTPKVASSNASTSDHHHLGHQDHDENNSNSETPTTPGKRSFGHRFSLRRGSTPLAGLSNLQAKQNARYSVATSTTSQAYETAESRQNSAVVQTEGERERAHVPKLAVNGEQVRSDERDRSGESSEMDMAQMVNLGNKDNNMMMIGEQSYRAWDVKKSLLTMIPTEVRTPGEGDGRAILPRDVSYVSRLSDERSDLDATPGTERSNNGIDDESEELRCRKCGNESFVMVKGATGTALRCRRCGESV